MEDLFTPQVLFMGIDPGYSGATSVITKERKVVASNGHKKNTPIDLAEFFDEVSQFPNAIVLAVIERVHSMPKQGVASSFKFGEQYGMMQGFLYACKIPFEFVTPHKWQTDMKCRTNGDKNVTKDFAQRTFPGVKITHANADSLLLSEYARLLAVEKGLI